VPAKDLNGKPFSIRFRDLKEVIVQLLKSSITQKSSVMSI
jgi:hypothetical protein